MSLFDDLMANETLASVKARVVGYAASAALAITDWIDGDPSEQMLQAMALMAFQAASQITAATRGFASIDTATDPGDDDPFDATNVLLPEGPGFLSNKGENDFGTPREGKSFAQGIVTFTNTGPGAQTFKPDALTFTWTLVGPPSPAPTYRNSSDATVYTNPDGSVTVAASSSINLPIQAEIDGAGSSAPSGAITLTTTLDGCSGTNAAPVVGRNREFAADYRARCKEAPARVSLAGPYDAYDYFAKTTLGGSPLPNASGNVAQITRTQQTQESSVGVVQAWYATASGVPSSDDVTAANGNIALQSFGVPGARTFVGQAATATSIHVGGTFKLKSGNATDAKIAIVKALAAAFTQFPIGGYNQTSGAGFIYTVDLQAIAAASYSGLYDVVVTTPGGATTALAIGHVATLNSVVGDWSQV